MTAGNYGTIDEYLETVDQNKREALQRLRRIILSAAPGAEECISYNMPAFRLNGRVVLGFAAAAKHCALYPWSGSIVEAFKNDLKHYSTSKGTIRFKPDDPLPEELVRRIVKARIEENERKN